MRSSQTTTRPKAMRAAFAAEPLETASETKPSSRTTYNALGFRPKDTSRQRLGSATV